MAPLETAIKELRQVLGADATSPEWRWLVRHRLSDIKEALSDQQARQWDGWLTARARTSNRDRHASCRHASPPWPRSSSTSWTRMPSARELNRLVGDLEHYVQRVHDLVYDSVSLELGGSE